LIPAHSSQPLLLCPGFGTLSFVLDESLLHLVHRLRTEEIDGVQKLSVLQKMAMAVPQPWYHVAGARPFELLQTLGHLIAEDA
jgi:hypothetical protein